MGLDYKAAGVDVTAGYKAVDLIKTHAQKTFRSEVMTGLGGFGGLFSLEKAKGMDSPVLVSGTDGVGTKLKLAFMTGKHDTIGIDCVAMCVNDIVCCGAEPLFFLDYIACGKNVPEKIEQIVKGIAAGCELAGCSLIGGETAEMPGMYAEDEYDLAGFSVGLVDKKNIISANEIEEGAAIIGIASSGAHSNGYSLIRKIFFENSTDNLTNFKDELGEELAEALMRPTKIYVKTILSLINKVNVLGISNITGGGFIENIPRSVPKGYAAKINKGSWEIPQLFKLMEKLGGLTKNVLFNTFNMGIGMTITVPQNEADKAVASLTELGEKAYIIGEIVKDDTGTGILL